MISIVSTSTITTALLAGAASLIAILVLLSLLVQKEITTTAGDNRTRNLSKALNIGIIPLIIVFALIVLTKIAEVTR